MGSASQRHPDAPESNAGDDFHLLWAARKAMGMLLPGAALTAIALEGLHPADAAEIDPGGEMLLGIDLTEYYGASTFAGASAVVVSQLKYSTRRSDVPWTAAKLSKGKDGTQRGSVIDRLSQAFLALRGQWGREQVNAKLRIRLVSNRAYSQAFAEAISAAQSVLSKATHEIQFRTLLRQVDKTHHDELKRLWQGTNRIASTIFVDLLRIFDPTGCGETSRLGHELALMREIGKSVLFDASRQFNSLKLLIQQRTMPESARLPPLTADDLAPVFGISHRGFLFPCPPRFAELRFTVEREQSADLSNAVVNAGDAPLCVHGGAGLGKTTLVRQLQRSLPQGSRMILFDCYGGGSYLNPDELRHGHPRAIMQITNALATCIGSPLLLSRDRPPEDLLEALRLRLELAAAVLHGECADALLVLVIDAADNSVAAARQRGDRSFVTDLLHCRIPMGCRLVVTTRTHRRGELDLPSNAKEFQIRPFSDEESRSHLAAHFRTATDPQAEEFHRLSYAIPRIQGYAIKAGGGELDRVLQSLRPAGRTVASLIDDQLEEAGLRSGSPESVTQICQAMLALPRPVPIDFVASMIHGSSDAVRDFCHDLFGGLSTQGDRISFCDEDFENHLRERHAPSPGTYAAMADLLLTRAKDDEYAASNLADALLAAGRDGAIVDLLQGGGDLAAIGDPVVRQEAFARQSRLALEAARRQGNPVKQFQLLFAVAQGSKVDHAVEQLLLEHADLACRYGDPATVQRLYLSPRNNRIQWYGPVHFLCAANFARSSSTLPMAKEHWEAARAWFRHYYGLPEQERQHLALTVDHLALGAEAVFRLKGARAAASWVRNWRPTAQIARRLIDSLAQNGGRPLVDLISSSRLRADVVAEVGVALVDCGIRLPKPLVLRTLSVLRRLPARAKQPDARLLRAIVVLCETAVGLGVALEAIRPLLMRFTPPSPGCRFLEYAEERNEAWDAFLRSKSLLSIADGGALDATDPSLVPQSLLAGGPNEDFSTKQRREQELEELRRFLGAVWPAYVLHAQVLLGRSSAAEYLKRIRSDDLFGQDLGHWRYGHDRSAAPARRLASLALVDAALQLDTHVKESLDTTCTRCLKGYGHTLRLQIARAVVQPTSGQDVALRLVHEAAVEATSVARPASELTTILIECCRVAGLADTDAGRHYFEQAVHAVAQVDEEAIDLLRCLAALSRRATTGASFAATPEDAEAMAQFTEACYWRLGDPDHFPWGTCIDAMARLDPKTAATALCRWDQRGSIPWQHHHSTFMRACLERNALRAEFVVACGVLGRPDSDHGHAVVLEAIERMTAGGTASHHRIVLALKTVSDLVCRVAPLDTRERLAKAVTDWAQCHRQVAGGPLRQIEELQAFLSSLERRGTATTDASSVSLPARSPKNKKLTSPPDLQAIRHGRSFTTTTEIEAAVRTVLDITSELEDGWFVRPKYIKQLLADITQSTSFKDYVGQLQALLETDAGVLEFEWLIEAIRDRLGTWEHHPLVRQWRKELAVQLVHRRFSCLMHGGFVAHDRLELLRDRLSIPEVDVLLAINEALPRHLRTLKPRAIYQFAERFVAVIASGDALEVLSVQLQELRKTIDQTKLLTHQIVMTDARSPGDSLESAILWHFLGHADRRLRWLAAHALRQLVHLGDTAILSSLAKQIANGRSAGMVIAGSTFYWFSAQLTFFMVLDRLSTELPRSLLPVAEDLAQAVLSSPEPHALIMTFARRAALRLVAGPDNPYTAATVQALEAALQPRIGPKPGENEPARVVGDYRFAGRSRFHFDWVDVLPYWYKPLGRVFGVEGEDFCQAAEQWICDRWGFDEEATDHDPVREGYRSHFQWELQSRRQGELPIVEDLSSFLQWNAMFCVAAQWIAGREVIPSCYSDEPNPWESWLDRWDIVQRGKWLSDLRQATPLDPLLWEPGRLTWPHDKIAAATDADFDRLLGVDTGLRPGFLVAYARVDRYRHGLHESLGVESALVALETAEALLHALAGSEFPSDYRIPDEGDELEFRKVIGDTRFQFIGLLRVAYGDTSGADATDPLRFSLRWRPVAPAAGVIEALNLERDTSESTPLYRLPSGEAFSILEQWSDVLPHQEQSGFATEGCRFWVNVKELLTFLRAKNLCLLVKCTMSLYGRQNTFDEKPHHEDASRLYLMRPEGTFQSARGCDPAGTTDC